MHYSDHGEDLTKFSEWAPTPMDPKGKGSEGQEDWRVLPVSRTRDSGTLSESNFETAEKMLEEAKVEYEIHRFRHWGPGWIEIIVVAPTEEGLTAAGEIACGLEGYPILDEDDYNTRQYEEAQQSWDSFGASWAVDQLVKLFDLQDEAQDLLRDSSEILWDWQMNGPEGYTTDGDGIMFPDHWNRLERDDMARLLKECRKARKAAA